MVTFDEFMRLEIKIGTVISASRVAGTERLIQLELDCGAETRQVVAGLAPAYMPEQLVGKQMPVVVNLAPRKLHGVESRGMVLAVDVGDRPILLTPADHVPPGSVVR
jgi:methionine--tRNA ligase beta chain